MSLATRRTLCALLPLALLAAAPGARAAAPEPGPPLTIARLTGAVSLDGDLGDPGWRSVEPVTKWFETNATDNTEPPVANKAWLAYDDHYLYAAFQFDDPNPRGIRAPLGDHDQLSGSTDYGGVILDTRNDARTAQLFLANASGLQYDALSSDVSGEDSSPDFFWDAAGKITATGWNLELRIPFSSMRYANPEAPTMGLLLYRNYPRDRHYQFFSARLPKDVNCFICNSSKLTGLQDLPRGSHLVVAPYTTAQRIDGLAEGADLGAPLESGPVDGDMGLDVKWSPASTMAIDATIHPDFSQVEADAAQIGANERFALFYPEKRTFFLEGVDLFATPLQAVYTRTVTSPDGGARVTGRTGGTAFTALFARDAGQGSVILPGPQGSDFAPQDFHSNVGIVRMRHDLGPSFVSALATVRTIDGGGHNLVAGPDFQWRPKPTDTVTGQFLFSDSRTPDRDTLAAEWDGRSLDDQAALLNWSHSTRHHDLFVQGQTLGRDFRADDGFIPQVGYRELYLETGWTERPQHSFLSRIRTFTANYVDLDLDGNVLSQSASVGAGMDGKANSFLRVELNADAFRVGDQLLRRFRPRVNVTAVPGRIVNSLSLDTRFGEEIDFANGRRGHGATITTGMTLRPDRHLELRNDASARWLTVNDAGRSGRLFLAEVERLRATWSFNSHAFVRLIGQYEVTSRDASLYTFAVNDRSAGFNMTGLFAYKLNWQTVLYAGYGDERVHADASGRLEPVGRQIFTKLSYALQL